MAGDFFSCSSTSLSFNIVCCLLSFPVCILHILSKRCSLLLFNSFSNTPFSVTIHNSLSFTWVALQISFFLEWLDMRLHFWFRHLNFLKILFFFFLIQKQSNHYMLQNQWRNSDESTENTKVKSKVKSRSRSCKKTYVKVLSFWWKIRSTHYFQYI